jgi:hypothetical protein
MQPKQKHDVCDPDQSFFCTVMEQFGLDNFNTRTIISLFFKETPYLVIAYFHSFINSINFLKCIRNAIKFAKSILHKFKFSRGNPSHLIQSSKQRIASLWCVRTNAAPSVLQITKQFQFRRENA